MSSLGALALQGPDGPLGDLLGYVILFMVVVWPIIRGVLEQAQSKRATFERQQAGRPTTPRRPRPSQRTLEELLSGNSANDPLADPDVEEIMPRTRPRASAPPPLPEAEAHSRIPVERRSRLPVDEGPRPSEQELVGDPFDDSIMGQDLVDHRALSDVPSEDELEVSVGSAPFDRARLRTALPSATSIPEGTEANLARMERHYTPWQRAFVFKEVLGPPAAMRPFHDRNI